MKSRQFFIGLASVFLGVVLYLSFQPVSEIKLKEHSIANIKQSSDKDGGRLLTSGGVQQKEVFDLTSVLAISSEYQSTRDLHSLFTKYRLSNNPTEKFFAWKAIDFCSRYLLSTNRDIFVSQPEPLPGLTQEQDAMNQRLFGKCAGFKEFTPTQYRAQLKQVQESAINGGSNSIAAVQANELFITHKNEEDAVKLAKQVLQSKEPDAIMALVDSMQVYWDAKKINQQNSGKPPEADTSAVALRLAACDLGRDCSKDALDMQVMCVYAGSCEDSLESRTMKLLTPAEADDVRQKMKIYLAAIKQGDLKIFGL
ncbi:hypothetical protein [Undibacterium sp. RuTC16W]|uniref:hypothetical protein n=1 Tax=Undibacterium sp. RuTC16W TaxID=3413048 RepID=UPI003BEFABC3